MKVAMIGSVAAPATTAGAAGPTGATGAAGTAGPQGDFKAMLQSLATQTVNDIKSADAAAMAGIEGRMDTRKVVDTVMAAEHSLQTAIAVRDKIVSAYLDLSRMQI